MFMLSDAANDTQRFLRCELCGKMIPEFATETANWFMFNSLSEPSHRMYACPRCFDPKSRESYVRMGQKLLKTIPPPPPLTIEELGL